MSPEIPENLPAPEGIALLHVDEHLIAIDKPAGLLSVPGRGPGRADCAAVRVQAAFPDALIVHRLDMGTSGVLVFGRGADAQRTLSLAFAERQVAKRYIAEVAGSPSDESGHIELPLICDWPNRPRQMVDHERGRPSTTLWRVLERHAASSRVELTPVTGRSHQLRVHLMSIGHPILGDELYAPLPVLAMAPRLLLHAECLTLPHPAHGHPLTLHSPAPF